MIVNIDGSDQRLVLLLAGEVRWNDRLQLSSLASMIASSSARELTVDARTCVERDRGSLSGVLATAERMARSGGRTFRQVAA